MSAIKDTLNWPDSSLSRRRFVSVIGAIGLGCGLPACGALTDKRLSVALHTWPGYELVFLAQREGWLDDKLVRIVETTAATNSMKALADGRVEAAALTLDEMFKVRETGLKLTIVMLFDVSAGADVLITRNPLKSLADIKGLRLAVEHSSVGELLLSEILQRAGLGLQDIKLVPLSIDQHVEGWKRGAFDVVITYEPVATELLNMGGHKLFDTRKLPDTIVDVLAVRSDALESHGPAIRHLIVSHFKGLDHLTRNPQDAAYRMAGHLNLPAEQVLPAFKGLLLPDAMNNHRLLAGESPGMLATARKLSEVMSRSKLLNKPDTLNDLIRADFLPAELLLR